MLASVCQAGQPNRARKGQGTQDFCRALVLKNTRGPLNFFVKAKQIAFSPKARCCEQNGKASKIPPVKECYIFYTVDSY